MPPADPAPRADAFDAAWLRTRRWFRAKRRPIREVATVDAAALPDAAGWLLVLGVRYDDGGEDRYLVPTVAVAGVAREPEDGEGLWRAIAGCVARQATLAGSTGSFVCTPTPALATLAAEVGSLERAAERQLDVEQSNTSVVLGERLILKLYRLVEPGTNPDLEVSEFLTAAGFAEVPPVAGSVRYLAAGEASAAAMLQALVPAEGDGWGWLLDRLGRGAGDDALSGVSAIGWLTRRLHDALASRPEVEGFPAGEADDGQRAAWRRAAEAELDAALQAVDGDHATRLVAVAAAIRERFAALEGARRMTVSRIHGDYHLGQLLRVGDGFKVIDFEGEPARPLAERRLPGAPLRDVAGMLRSLDYAAHTAIPGDAQTWLARARRSFLAAYGASAADGPLLAALEAEKACYEVRYEANNRPAWTWLPLAALERMAAAAAGY